jgi:hypothetical protein
MRTSLDNIKLLSHIFDGLEQRFVPWVVFKFLIIFRVAYVVLVIEILFPFS